jgi:site-specific DNA recombinase
MSPSYSVKNGIRYPFYVSSCLLKGRKEQSGSVARVSATAIEQAVLLALRNEAGDDLSFTGLPPREFAQRTVERIVVRGDRLTITLHPGRSIDSLEIPWSASNRSGESGIEGDAVDPGKPDEALVQTVARAHVWIDLLSAGAYDSIDDLATAAGVHPKVIRNRIRLAFLSPDLNRAILSGEQPANASLAELNGPISLSWHRQGNKLHGSG